MLVTTADADAPRKGSPLRVEIRDTSKIDVAATTVCSAEGVVGEGVSAAPTESDIALVGLEAGQVPCADLCLHMPDDVADLDSLTVWAQIAAGEGDHVSAGDWITVQAYPVLEDVVVVEVVQV